MHTRAGRAPTITSGAWADAWRPVENLGSPLSDPGELAEHDTDRRQADPTV